jgi:hypothetical protein
VDVHGERFFTHHVFASVKSANHLLKVKVVWGANVDHVNLGIAHQLIEGSVPMVKS